MKIYSLTEVLQKLNMRTKTQLQRRLGYKSTGTMSKWDREGIPPAAMVEIQALAEWKEEDKKADLGEFETALIGMMGGVSEETKREIFLSAAQIIGGSKPKI